MSNGYSLLKGTVSHLKIFEDKQEMRSDDVGLIALIGLTIMGLIGAAGALIGTLTSGSVKLEGQHFYCYVGSKKVEGCLVRVGFNEGDYVEMIVKPQKYNTYRPYAVRIPQQHAFFFPRAVGTPTLELLKYCSIFMGAMSLFGYLVILAFSFLYGSFCEDFFILSSISLLVFVFTTLLLFFMLKGRYSFLSNRIYAIFGYTKPWLFNSVKEDLRFKKMNRSEAPELFDDPQTPEFTKLTKFTPFAHYYCRTPIIPDWVDIIDERGKKPNEHEFPIVIKDND